MTERTAVQNPILKYANEIGWEIVSRSDAESLRGFNPIGERRSYEINLGGTAVQERAGNSSLFFDNILYHKAKEFNRKLEDTKEELVRRLSILQSSIQGNKDFLSYLRGEKTFFSKEDNREYNLTLIDFKNPENNLYHVTEEYYYFNGHYGNREDIVFLINGIPVVVIECKNTALDEAIAIGIDQIRRYHKETPEMMVPQ